VARKIPPQRFDDLVRQATEVFITSGYRHTQMADIADAVGVSKGTLYLYVEGKEALFALCCQHADDPAVLEKPDVLPVPTPPLGSLEAAVKARLQNAGASPVLEDALERDHTEDPARELRDVLNELYTQMEDNSRGIKLLDRCWDHPGLGPLWQASGREGPRRRLAQYIEARARAEQLRSDPSPRLLARLAIETIATWAMHIKWDRSPEHFEPESTKEAVLDYIVRGLLLGKVVGEQGGTR